MTNTAIPQQRHLVLVDIENLLGNPSPNEDDVREAQRFLSECIGLCGDEHVVVACSHHAAAAVTFGWSGACRRKWRSGADGADHALLEVLQHDRVVERFTDVTIVSGDGIFAEALTCLAAEGLETTVVALDSHLSRRSRLAARKVVELVDAPWMAAGRGAA